MSSPPLLSVIVPTFNRSPLLARLLETVEVAWHRSELCESELEILVYDNASTDDTWPMLQKLTKESRLPLQLKRQDRNVGFIGNIMSGFTQASGKWVMVCGDDDEMHEEGLSRIFHTIGSHHADLYSFWTESNPASDWVERTKCITLREMAAKYYYYPGNCGLAVASGVLVRKAVDILKKNNVRISTWAIMDIYGCATALSTLPQPICLSPAVIARHPNHGSSTSLSSYYLFEITYVGLIRSAQNVDHCTAAGITSAVTKSSVGSLKSISKLWGIFRIGLLYDLPEDTAETLRAANHGLRNLPKTAIPFCFAVCLLQKIPPGGKKMMLWIAYQLRNPLNGSAKFKAAMTARAHNLIERKRKLSDKDATGIYTSANLS